MLAYTLALESVISREEGVLCGQDSATGFLTTLLPSLISAIALLKDQEPGAFIIRDSHSFRGAYGLAMKVSSPPPTIAQQGKKGSVFSPPGWGFLLSSEPWVLSRVLTHEGWSPRSWRTVRGGLGTAVIGTWCVWGVSWRNGRECHRLSFGTTTSSQIKTQRHNISYECLVLAHACPTSSCNLIHLFLFICFALGYF